MIVSISSVVHKEDKPSLRGLYPSRHKRRVKVSIALYNSTVESQQLPGKPFQPREQRRIILITTVFSKHREDKPNLMCVFIVHGTEVGVKQ